MGGRGTLFQPVWGRADRMSRTTSIVKFVMRTFVLHISIASPLGESGKLQMASDMTGLEFALNAFTVDGTQSKRGGNLESIGDEYRALRAMRWVNVCFKLDCETHTKKKKDRYSSSRTKSSPRVATLPDCHLLWSCITFWSVRRFRYRINCMGGKKPNMSDG